MTFLRGMCFVLHCALESIRKGSVLYLGWSWLGVRRIHGMGLMNVCFLKPKGAGEKWQAFFAGKRPWITREIFVLLCPRNKFQWLIKEINTVFLAVMGNLWHKWSISWLFFFWNIKVFKTVHGKWNLKIKCASAQEVLICMTVALIICFSMNF